MTNLRTLLDQASGPASPHTPPAGLVQADLARAHRGLRRERVGRGARGGLLAVAAAGVVAVLVQTGSPTGATPERAATPPASSSAAGVGDTQMVAYTGTQPAGFTLDALPRGWEVQGVDAGVLTLAPAGIADQDPNSFAGKVAVFLENLPQAATGDRVRPVQVGTTTGLLFESDLNTGGDRLGGTTLFLAQPSGTQLAVQVWAGLGWSDTDIAALGAAIHVTDAATVSVG
ncbi:hypothetical protein OG218_03610 [Kineococcus sp. NBC_00420]|uniref:hypothetical protein n=1 Tax=Kineococcus sp. NBC_00420 TaxID=2903564 RepID=UPI002E1A90DE